MGFQYRSQCKLTLTLRCPYLGLPYPPPQAQDKVRGCLSVRGLKCSFDSEELVHLFMGAMKSHLLLPNWKLGSQWHSPDCVKPRDHQEIRKPGPENKEKTMFPSSVVRTVKGTVFFKPLFILPSVPRRLKAAHPSREAFSDTKPNVNLIPKDPHRHTHPETRDRVQPGYSQ